MSGAILLASAGVLHAADIVEKAPPAASPAPYNWAGLYVGANFGGAWTNDHLSIPGNNIYGGISEFIGGAQVGYNFQAGRLLFGVEGDFGGAVFNHPSLPIPTFGSVSNKWIGTVAGRFGVVEDRWLVYGKLGAGWVHGNTTLNFPVSWNESHTHSGWLYGAGIEYGFKSHWTIKLEYNYLTQPNWASATLAPISLNRDIQMVKAGINYKFEGGFSDVAERERATRAAAKPAEGNLAKKSQNPVADMVSVPFQSNTNFNAGRFKRTQQVLNIQPVVPLHINENWNVISRTIVPIVSQPDLLSDSNTNGIGDVTQQFFVSPAHPGSWIWGLGPIFTLPSATDLVLGQGRVLFGPTAVLLTTPGPWVIGVLANNQWSVGGNRLRRNVNELLVQPFVNYNMAHGWYLTTSPIVTADWLAASGQKWTVPIGGGFGRLFKIGDQPVSASIAGYYNVIKPDTAPSWQLRFQVALLFPER